MPPAPAQNIPVPVDEPIEARIAAAVKAFGESAVIKRAVSLIAGNNEGEDFLLYVGGEHARGIINGAPPLYWPELWGTRALLYVWDETAGPAIAAALANQAWRVREMACRVSGKRQLPESEALVSLLSDEVARVRAAAARALGDIGSTESAESVRALLKDPEIEVRRGAQYGLAKLKA